MGLPGKERAGLVGESGRCCYEASCFRSGGGEVEKKNRLAGDDGLDSNEDQRECFLVRCRGFALQKHVVRFERAIFLRTMVT